MSTPQPTPLRETRRDVLSPEELRRLSTLRPGRAVADTALGWLRIGLGFAAVAWWPTWWMVLLAIPWIGTARYAHQVLAHDGIHRRLLRSAPANDLFCDLLLLGPVAAVTRVSGQNHLAHHRHLSGPDDPDRYKYSVANKGSRGRLLREVYRLPLDWLRGRTDPGAAGEDGSRPAERYRPRDLALIAGWQLLLFAGLTLSIGWWAYPVLWALPVYCFMYLGDFNRQFLEHARAEPDAQADRHRLMSFDSSPLERLFLAPHNTHLHAAHHLWPSIPYYHLPEADRLLRSRNRSPELEWRPSYLGALRDYWRALPVDAPGPARG